MALRGSIVQKALWFYERNGFMGTKVLWGIHESVGSPWFLWGSMVLWGLHGSTWAPWLCGSIVLWGFTRAPWFYWALWSLHVFMGASWFYLGFMAPEASWWYGSPYWAAQQYQICEFPSKKNYNEPSTVTSGTAVQIAGEWFITVTLKSSPP